MNTHVARPFLVAKGRVPRLVNNLVFILRDESDEICDVIGIELIVETENIQHWPKKQPSCCNYKLEPGLDDDIESVEWKTLSVDNIPNEIVSDIYT